jgi:hypothetical protein
MSSEPKDHWATRPVEELHIADKNLTEPNKGCTNKCGGKPHGDYRKNGYAETERDPEKSALYNLDFAELLSGRRKLHAKPPIGATTKGLPTMIKRRSERNPRLNSHDWWIGGLAPKKNFKSAYLPYNNEAHHILPAESLKDAGTGPHSPNEIVLKMIMHAEYNLNAGVNIILLPKNRLHASLIQLPVHNGYHEQYNSDVTRFLNKILRDVNQAIDTHQVKLEDGVNLKNDIEKWQAWEFKRIVFFGKEKPTTANIDRAPIAQTAFN